MSESSAKQLKKRGYRVVSIKHRLVSRIDRADWEDFNPDEDYYRRCLSKDSIVVPASYLTKIPNSQHSKVGYIKPLIQ